jgi:hypothetical protein
VPRFRRFADAQRRVGENAPTLTALTMTKFAARTPTSTAAAAAGLFICSLLIIVASGTAFGDNAVQTPNAPAAPSAPPAAPGAGPAATAAPPQASPNYQPGFLHQLRIWWDDSVALFDRKDRNPPNAPAPANKKPDDTGPGMTDKAKEAAASAMTTSQDAMNGAVEATKGAASSASDVMKNAMEATKGAASSAVEATKDAATAIVRLPNIRVMQVNEVCARAPNGASDCGTAATNICRAKGFNGGVPLDVRTSSRCDPKPAPQAGQTPTVHCGHEAAVTRVVCQ